MHEDTPREVAAGAIGKAWRPVIPFVHVPDAAAFGAFYQHGYIKVAWVLRVVAKGERTSRVDFELRVVATDDEAWKKFTRYVRLIGPGSHFIRRVLLAQLKRELGTPALDRTGAPSGRRPSALRQNASTADREPCGGV